MLYRILADTTAVVHFAFVAYVVVGGFIAWRWPRTIYLHVAAFTWGFSTILFGIDCPLTFLENWARHRAGDQGLPPSGFIAHYITGVIYPESALGLIRLLVAVSVVISWIGYGVLRSRGSSSTHISSRMAH
ncbi:DUF2784 domain-containing protein [Antrihabitans cavernicola]|uniref:DUF2784 domain-containing protein n=1 Tax=Antrihabitans cavernicola TaxID=2495913 RepID=A0A5A7SDJ6_9NOCA|nr:DUF2784 domain-containing protein [Spelaeibacter cavernicola]KAA0023604.1 DUF2784 domain-containing protein [Spelaeibacter cavernicola]